MARSEHFLVADMDAQWLLNLWQRTAPRLSVTTLAGNTWRAFDSMFALSQPGFLSILSRTRHEINPQQNTQNRHHLGCTTRCFAPFTAYEGNHVQIWALNRVFVFSISFCRNEVWYVTSYLCRERVRREIRHMSHQLKKIKRLVDSRERQPEEDESLF